MTTASTAYSRESTEGPRLPDASDPATDLRSLAVRWGMGEHTHDRSGIAAHPSSPIQLASAVGLECKSTSERICDLVQSQLPALLLRRDGRSRLMEEKVGSKIRCSGPNGSYTADIDQLEREAADTVLILRQARTSASEQTPSRLRPWSGRIDLVVAVFSFLWSSHPTATMHLLLVATLCNLLALSLPLFSMAVYDRVIPHLAMETLWALSFGVLLSLSAELLLRTVRLRLQDALATASAVQFTETFYQRLLKTPLKDTPSAAGGVTHAVRDLEALSQIAPLLAVVLCVDLPFFVLIVLVIAAVAGWIAALPILAALLIITLYLAAHVASKEYGAAVAKDARALSNQLIDTVEAIATIKANAAEQFFHRKWAKTTLNGAVTGHKFRFLSQMGSQFALILTQAISIIAMIIGVYQIAASTMSVGELAAVSMLLFRAMAPIGQIVTLAQRRSELGRALVIVKQVLQSSLEQAGEVTRSSEVSEKSAKRLETVSLTLSYPSSPLPAISEVSLRIEPGERVGIVGRSGAGKTSLLKLLVRLEEPSSGALYLDGRDIRQWNPYSLRQSIAFMQQDVHLFDETVRTNILLGRDPDPEFTDDIVRLTGVSDFTSRSPNGLDLLVGTRGQRLSGGERQSVALARTLIGQPSTLLLDEPTSAMDPALEARVIKQLKAWLCGRTLIIATHRSALLDLVDRIIWMDQGRIVADGPKAEVLKKLRAVS